MAVAYATHHYRQEKRVENLFRLLENTLLFVENVLRAQAMDYAHLIRPASMGFRISNIKKLHAENVSSVQPFVAAMLAEEDRISRIVRERNRWAHGADADQLSGRRDIGEIENDMDRILEPLTNLQLILRRRSEDSADCFLLLGLRGLFEPELLHNAPEFPPQSDLAAVESEFVIPLSPFITWSPGLIGENRIQLLTNLRGELGIYSDAVDGETNTVIVPR